TPVNGNTVSTIRATASMRGLLVANIATAATRRMSTIARSVFIDSSWGQLAEMPPPVGADGPGGALPSVRVHPARERVEAVIAAQEVPHQLGGFLRATGRQHSIAQLLGRRRGQQIVVLEGGEQVLGDHLGPQIRVVRGSIALEVPEGEMEVRAVDVLA